MASRGAGAAIAAGTASSMGSAGPEDSGAHIVDMYPYDPN